MLSHRSDPLVSEQLRKAPKKRPIVQQPELPKVEQQPVEKTIETEIDNEQQVIEIPQNPKIENNKTIEENDDEEEVLVEIHKVNN